MVWGFWVLRALFTLSDSYEKKDWEVHKLSRPQCYFWIWENSATRAQSEMAHGRLSSSFKKETLIIVTHIAQFKTMHVRIRHEGVLNSTALPIPTDSKSSTNMKKVLTTSLWAKHCGISIKQIMRNKYQSNLIRLVPLTTTEPTENQSESRRCWGGAHSYRLSDSGSFSPDLRLYWQCFRSLQIGKSRKLQGKFMRQNQNNWRVPLSNLVKIKLLHGIGNESQL